MNKELRGMTKKERQEFLETLHEEYRSLSKEERKKLNYFKLKNEAHLIDLSEQFLEQVDCTSVTEELLNKKEWLLKNIVVKDGYTPSADLKNYLLENYK